MTTITGGHHIALTARVADQSAHWYWDRLGMQVVLKGDEEEAQRHLAFGVSSRAELKGWEQQLRAAGIAFAPIAERPSGSVIVFRDPGHIQLEFFLPAGP
jgi:glyoxylase I family protein